MKCNLGVITAIRQNVFTVSIIDGGKLCEALGFDSIWVATTWSGPARNGAAGKVRRNLRHSFGGRGRDEKNKLGTACGDGEGPLNTQPRSAVSRISREGTGDRGIGWDSIPRELANVGMSREDRVESCARPSRIAR